MKKIIRLTESDLARIVKRVINEEMKGGVDSEDPKSHFDTVINELKSKGFKTDDSMARTMGVIDLTNTTPSSHRGIIVRYCSPYHPENKKNNNPVVELIVNNTSKKKWFGGANMYEVIKEVKKYLPSK